MREKKSAEDGETHLSMIPQALSMVSFKNYREHSTFLVAIQELQRKYPDVLSYTLNQPERARALRELEQIFVNAGPQVFVPGDDQRVTRFLKEFERGINGLINTIQKELPGAYH
jgi:hypothetical protein